MDWYDMILLLLLWPFFGFLWRRLQSDLATYPSFPSLSKICLTVWKVEFQYFLAVRWRVCEPIENDFGRTVRFWFFIIKKQSSNETFVGLENSDFIFQTDAPVVPETLTTQSFRGTPLASPKLILVMTNYAVYRLLRLLLTPQTPPKERNMVGPAASRVQLRKGWEGRDIPLGTFSSGIV